MPKTSLEPRKSTKDRRQLADDIVRLYGMTLTITKVTHLLGYKCPKAAKKWLKDSGIIPTTVGGRDRWLATDIARALDNAKIAS